MKRFLALFLVLSMVLSVSALAADYELRADAMAISVGDTEIMPLADGEYASQLNSIYVRLGHILSGIGGTTSAPTSNLFTLIRLVSSALDDLESSVGSNHSQLFNWLTGGPMSNSSLANSIVQAIDTSNDMQSLAESNVMMYQLMLGDSSNISDIEVSNQGIYDLLSDLNLSSWVLPVGTQFVSAQAPGMISTASVPLSPSIILKEGFFYLRKAFTLVPGTGILGMDGTMHVYDSSSNYGFVDFMRNGFVGIRSLIAGSETDNVYSGKLLGSDNKETEFNATGLGPMLQTYLDAIQDGTGLLSFMFASPEDIEMKENAADVTEAFNDTFLDPDSSTSLKVSDVTSIGDAAQSITGFGDTGVSPTQAFIQLGDGSLFEFFTQTTADNLDTVPDTYSLRSDPRTEIVTNYFEQNRADFFSILDGGGE